MKGLLTIALVLASLLPATFCMGAATDKTVLTGQVSISNGPTNKVKLGSVYINLYPLDAVNAAKDEADKQDTALRQSVQPEIDARKNQYKDDTFILNTKLNSAGSHGGVDYTSADIKNALTKQNQDIKVLNQLVYNSIYYKTPYFYMKELGASTAHKVADAKGKFSLQVPKSGSWVIEAWAYPIPSANSAPYFWCFNLSAEDLTKGHIVLNESNLATATNSSNVVNLLDQTAIDSMLADVLK